MIIKVLTILGIGDKALWKSVTIWGLALYAAGDAGLASLCGNPELTFSGTFTTGNEFCDAANSFMEKAGFVLSALGIRKAAKGQS